MARVYADSDPLGDAGDGATQAPACANRRQGRRSNRPGNSQAKGPAGSIGTLESGADAPAEGIAISGGRTAGAVRRAGDRRLRCASTGGLMSEHDEMDGQGDASGEALARTPLTALHESLGARMAPFAGWLMPVQYPSGILREHAAAREGAALFDVSHMCQVILRPRSGKLEDAALALERIAPISVAGLAPDRQRYGLFTAPNGGILDDFMVANRGDHLFLVVNAARRDHDLAHLRAHLPAELSPRPLIHPADLPRSSTWQRQWRQPALKSQFQKLTIIYIFLEFRIEISSNLAYYLEASSKELQ